MLHVWIKQGNAHRKECLILSICLENRAVRIKHGTDTNFVPCLKPCMILATIARRHFTHRLNESSFQVAGDQRSRIEQGNKQWALCKLPSGMFSIICCCAAPVWDGPVHTWPSTTYWRRRCRKVSSMSVLTSRNSELRGCTAFRHWSVHGQYIEG